MEKLQTQEAYDRPLETGMYLGFFLPGDTVVMRRIQDFVGKSKPPYVVACAVARLFE